MRHQKLMQCKTEFMGIVALFLFFFTSQSNAQTEMNSIKSDSIMITILLKHQQDKSLDSLQKIQKENKLWEQFPPKSAKVVSWYVMMGIGQVVTLKIPASELRTLNLAVERGAWGAFNSEFYPTYDFKAIWEENYKKSQKQ
ncbi:MAG: hypothetical protein ACSHXF_07400 [Aquaticitalea sp.]